MRLLATSGTCTSSNKSRPKVDPQKPSQAPGGTGGTSRWFSSAQSMRATRLSGCTAGLCKCLGPRDLGRAGLPAAAWQRPALPRPSPCLRRRAPALRAPSADRKSRRGWEARCRWRWGRTAAAGGRRVGGEFRVAGGSWRTRHVHDGQREGRPSRVRSPWRVVRPWAGGKGRGRAGRPAGRTSAPMSAAQRAPSGNHCRRQAGNRAGP